jgi:hypothetical protein
MTTMQPSRTPLAFEQQPKESNRAFAAFSLYLSLGSKRSVDQAALALKQNVSQLRRWSVRYSWPARVAAHVAYMATVEREATEALVRCKAAGWLARQQGLREEEWEMHEKCIAAAKKALATFMDRDKAGASLADIARILEVASKLGRLAAGMSTDKTEVSGQDGGAIRVELTAALNKIYGEAQPGPVVDVETVGEVPADARETHAIPGGTV